MEASIVSFRRSLKRTKGNEMILFIEKCDSKEKAEKYIGKHIEYKTDADNVIKGTIKKAHGRNGCVLADFEKGMPGQALGRTVKII